MAVLLRMLDGWTRGVRDVLARWTCDVRDVLVDVVVPRVTRGISGFVEAARTLLTSPDKTRDVPGPVRVVSTDQVQPVAVAPQVIVPTAQVVGPVPGGVPGPVRIVPGPLPAQARVVPVLTGVAGPQVMPVPAQPATVPRPAPEPELASVRDPVPVTAEDIEAGWISRTVVINGCEFTRIGKVYYNSRGRLVIPKLRTGKVVQR